MDCGAALAHVVRIDMRPDAVARRLSEKALALLDSPAALDASPPATPQRFSLPLQTIASDQSLASMVPGGGEPEPLKPLQPSPLGLPPGAPRAYAHSHSASAASSAAAEDERLRALSPFAAPTV